MEFKRLISGILSLIVAPLVLLAGCGFLNSGSSSETFTLNYRAHLGLDCGMIFECGYRIEVDETGVVTFFDEPDDAEAADQINISQNEIQEIRDILDQYDFFTSEYNWSNEEGSLSYGSARITYQEEDDAQGRIKTIPFEGEGIPESLASLRIEMDRYLRSKFNVD